MIAGQDGNCEMAVVTGFIRTNRRIGLHHLIAARTSSSPPTPT